MSALTKNKHLYNFLIMPLIILIAAFIRSVCVVVFILPYDFAPGGATGIATMVEYATRAWFGVEFSAGYVTLIINAPLLIFAFFFINKGFALKSGAVIVLYSIGIVLMQRFGFPAYENGEPVLAACASGVLGGVGLALMLKVGGSTGGTDIIASYIQRKFSATHVAWFIYGLDAVVVFISAFVYQDGLTPVLMSLVEMFCLAMMSDVISSGFKTALKFEIVTHDADALSDELIHTLRRGVTCLPAKGMYSRNDTNILICVIRKHQLSEFNEILKKYPDTFAYVTKTSEVMGLGFSRFEELATATQTPVTAAAATADNATTAEAAATETQSDTTIEN